MVPGYVEFLLVSSAVIAVTGGVIMKKATSFITKSCINQYYQGIPEEQRPISNKTIYRISETIGYIAALGGPLAAFRFIEARTPRFR